MEVLKTVKMYVGGAFIRSESGATVPFINHEGDEYARVCVASRKDFRNAVVAARKALGGWAGRAHFNRGQILYRIAEMLEGRLLLLETPRQIPKQRWWQKLFRPRH